MSESNATKVQSAAHRCERFVRGPIDLRYGFSPTHEHYCCCYPGPAHWSKPNSAEKAKATGTNSGREQSTDDGRATRPPPRAPRDAALLLPAAAPPPPPFISRAQPLIKPLSCIPHSYKLVVSLDLPPYPLPRCSLYLNIGVGIPGDLIFIFLFGTRIWWLGGELPLLVFLSPLRNI
jgi:hypothetical protein